MSPIETSMIIKIIAAAGIVFVIGYVGNLISFSNRFVNALVTAIVFAAIYGALYFGIDRATLPPELAEASQKTWLQMIATSAIMVFVIDLIANMISFQSRFMNALVTAVVFALLFGAAIYVTGGMPSSVPA